MGSTLCLTVVLHSGLMTHTGLVIQRREQSLQELGSFSPWPEAQPGESSDEKTTQKDALDAAERAGKSGRLERRHRY